MCTTIFRRGVWGVGYALLAVFASHSASGQVLHESAKLLPADGATLHHFGGTVSISGDVTVAGSEDDDNGLNSGSAYVFRRNGSSWVQEQKLLASDGATNDSFGSSVSVSAEVVVVGAFHDSDNGPYSGSAYMFRYDPSQTICGEWWCEEQKLLASDGTSNDWFGSSVSVSGDVAVVGALQEYGGAGPTQAYVFRYRPERPVGDRWVEEQKLQPSDGAEYGLFAFPVCVSGDVIVASARWDDVNGTDSGSAFVYRWNAGMPGSWVFEQKLLASDVVANDWFGDGLTVSGDVAVVGADLHDHNGADSGSAYVFRYDASESVCGRKWCEEQELLPSDGTAGALFGWVVSVSGDVAVVGAGWDDDNGDRSGSAYVFRWSGSSWIQEHKLLPSDGAAGDRFGVGNSVSGNLALLGAQHDDDNGYDSGSAYVFSLVGTCCISNGSCEVAGNCQENITPSACQALGGRFFGPNLSCTEVCANGSCIPTVSAWGVVVLLLLIAAAGTIVLVHRRIPAR